MGFPLSWNVDGQDLRAWLKDNNYAGLRSHLLNLNPAAILIMDSLPIAVMVKGWLPKCIVIHRNYSKHEGGEWQARPPHEMVGQWKREGHKEIVRYLTNEPGVGADTVTDFVAREVETMKLAREAGFTVVALNTSVGTPEPELIEAGKFDALLKAAVQYEHYLGCHEYYTLCLPASLMGDEALLDKNALQPANWPHEKITVDTKGVHYLFRSVRFVKRSRVIGIGDPRIIHIEFGYDDTRNDGNGHIFDILRAKYGLLQYNGDMRGVNTYQRAWGDIYPGVDHNDVIRQQMEWWLDVKPDWVIAACIYGINADWSIPQGHDWSDNVRRSFFPVLEEMSKAMTQPRPEVIATLYTGDDWRRGKVRTSVAGSFTNMRMQPNIQSPDMGDIRELKAFDIAFERDKIWFRAGGNYSWVALRHLDDGRVVYVSSAHVMIEIDIPDAPTPDVPDEPLPPTDPPLPFDEVAIEAIVNRVIDLRLENLRSHIDEGHIPRTLAITISRAMRVLADMLDAAIALEEIPPQPTTAQIAADVYDKNNDVEADMLVKALTDKP